MANQGVPPRSEGMFAAIAAVAIRRRADSADVETMRGARLEAKETSHHRLPLAAMGTGSMSLLDVIHQPVRHLVRYHLDHEGQAILLEQHRVEAQSAATQMRLSGRLTAQVQPDARPRQARMELAAEPPGSLHPLVKHGM